MSRAPTRPVVDDPETFICTAVSAHGDSRGRQRRCRRSALDPQWSEEARPRPLMLPLHFLRVLNPLILGSIVDTYRRRPSELRGHVGPIIVESDAYCLAVPDDVLRREVLRQQVRGAVGATDLHRL